VAETGARQGQRQYVKYSFYRVDPAWRRLPEEERAAGKRELEAVVSEVSGRMLVRSYSLVGLRGDADFLLWQVAWKVEELQAMAAQVYRTGLGKYLTMPYSYFALTRHSPYLGAHRHRGQEGAGATLRPSRQEYPYLIVYPFVKTPAWYQLPQEERQRMMDQHFTVGHKYPAVRINTTYSFGLDDQEHVVAFETTDLGDFLELVMELRGAAARPFTLRDTPTFTCVAGGIGEVLETLG
jgi:chlorite dismutase